MSATPRVSIVIVSFNSREHILRCLAAVEREAGLPHEVLVVDNASADGTPEAVRQAAPNARVIANDHNLGFARANNQALARAQGAFVLLLNPDCELRPGALEALLGSLDAHPQVAAVGPLTRNSDGTPQVSFGPDLTLANEWRQRRLVNGVRARQAASLAAAEALVTREQRPDWISAACLLTRIEALRALGGFDEGFFLYEEDADLCLRLRKAGWQILHYPGARVVHHLGGSMSSAPSLARLAYQRSHLRYYAKHNGWLQRLGLRAVLAGAAVLGCLRAWNAPAARRLQTHLLRLALLEEHQAVGESPK